jgi:hypothetical protein
VRDFEHEILIFLYVKKALASAGLSYTETDVLQVELRNIPGALGEFASKLAEKDINITLGYQTAAKSSKKATGVDHGSMLPSVQPASLLSAGSELAKRKHEKQSSGARHRTCDECVHVRASADGGGGVEALPFGQPGRGTCDYRS